VNDQPETLIRQPDGAGWPADEEGTLRPLSLTWMTDELIDRTRAVWSQAYGRDISDVEAVEILSNVRRLAEATIRLQRERKQHERRHLGESLVS
jgi:hypothetical protein